VQAREFRFQRIKIWSGGTRLRGEVWPEFPFISERLAIRDFSRLSCQRVTCTPVQCLFCNEYGAPIARPCGQAMLERRRGEGGEHRPIDAVALDGFQKSGRLTGSERLHFLAATGDCP
jgi:hypothetical protein